MQIITKHKRDKINELVNVLSLMIDEISQISGALFSRISAAICVIKDIPYKMQHVQD